MRKIVPQEIDYDLLKEMLQLRLSGLSYEQIATQIGCSRTKVTDSIKKYLAIRNQECKEKADEIITLDVMRLDNLYNRALQDNDINACIRILERKHKLLGLEKQETNNQFNVRIVVPAFLDESTQTITVEANEPKNNTDNE